MCGHNEDRLKLYIFQTANHCLQKWTSFPDAGMHCLVHQTCFFHYPKHHIRSLLYDFARMKVNLQYRELKKVHPNAFVWVDEPGLGWVFNSFAGYNELQAQEDYRHFLDEFEGPRALHLCLNVHLPYLFGLGLDIISFDAFQFGTMPKGYLLTMSAN